MPYLDRGNTDFKRDTARTGHLRSGDLKTVDRALTAAQSTPTDAKLTYLLKALQNWHDKNRKEFMKRGRASGAYSGLWAEIETKLGRRAVVWATAQSKSWNKSPFIWVSEKKELLDRMKTYGSMDMTTGSSSLTPCCQKKIVFRDRNKANGTFTCSTCKVEHPEDAADLDWTRGFGTCVNPANRAAVLRTYREAVRRGADSGMPPPTPGAWNAGKAKSAYDQVNGQKAGICTLFAYAAAHILTYARPAGPCVEVVAYDNHVYVVVGRGGRAVAAGEDLPPVATWGTAYSIVDPWAGAMGYEVVYKQSEGFPYTGMMSPLKLFMKRDAA